MNVTTEQITQAVAIYGIHRYVVRECSICNSPLSYVFSPDGLQAAFDGACDCSSWHPPEPRDLENVAEHFNRQSEEVRAELWIQFTASGDGRKPLEFGYTNHRGEYGARRVAPLGVWFGSTEYHPEPQWLLKGIDLNKNAERDFALKDFGIRHESKADQYAAALSQMESAADLALGALPYRSGPVAEFMIAIRDHANSTLSERPATSDANEIAFALLDKIDQLNAAEWRGGDTQRRAAIQVAIRDAIEAGAAK